MKQPFIIYFILGTIFFLHSCDNGEDVPVNGSAVNCGANIHDSWYDTDDDGISNDVENNNRNPIYGVTSDPDYGIAPHPDFEPDTTCNTDSSEAVGSYNGGSLTGGINLPDKTNGVDGYYHYTGCCDYYDVVDGDDWGTLALINIIELTGLDFGTSPPMGVGDMSLRTGGYMHSHDSHQNGLDVDVRYVRNDGQMASLDLSNSDSVFYDRTATLKLMQYFVNNGNVTVIYVDEGLTGITSNDISVVSDAFDHHHHFHVRISE